MVELVYGDTDSVMVANISRKQAELLEDNLNHMLEEYTAAEGCKYNYLEIEFEAYAERALFVSKKRYAMRLDDGSYKIMGMQMKRSDVPVLGRELQEEILHMILGDSTKKEIRNYYLEVKNKTLEGYYDDKIGIPRKFTKDLDEYANNFAIEGAKYSNKYLGKHYGKGDKVRIYKIKRTDMDHNVTDAIAIDHNESLPSGFLIDRREHWNRVDKTVHPILDDIGALEKTKQVGLDAFL